MTTPFRARHGLEVNNTVLVANTITNSVSIGGALNVTGNTTVSNLTSNGVVALETESLTISGNLIAANITGSGVTVFETETLTVSGNTTSANLTAGIVTVTGTFSTANVAAQSVSVTGNTTTMNLAVSGTAALSGDDLTITGNTTTVNLIVSGTATFTADELVIGTVKHNSYSIFVSATNSTIIDTFPNTSVRSAVYRITANNANLDSYVTTLAVTNRGNLLEYGNVSSNGALATFSATEVSGNVRVNAASTFANTTYYIYRITQG